VGITAYLVVYLLIGMFLFVIGTWIYLAKMDFQAQTESATSNATTRITKVLRIIGYILAASSCVFTVFIASAYIYTIINPSHSDVWLRDRSLVHRQILIEMIILIFINSILGAVFRRDKWLSRIYWICSSFLLSVALIHGVISFIYGQSALI